VTRNRIEAVEITTLLNQSLCRKEIEGTSNPFEKLTPASLFSPFIWSL